LIVDTHAPAGTQYGLTSEKALPAYWGIFDDYSSSKMSDNIITDNYHGIVTGGYSDSMITNNDVWRNYYVDIYGGPTEGNISVDPMFVDSSTGNYRLHRSSPCIV
jgi:parallel beta-helix repeat protein